MKSLNVRMELKHSKAREEELQYQIDTKEKDVNKMDAWGVSQANQNAFTTKEPSM